MEVYVESQSQFHPRQFDRYRVEVGKAETRAAQSGHAPPAAALAATRFPAPAGPSLVTRS